MKIKNFYKFGLVILALVGISFVAAASFSTQKDTVASMQVVEKVVAVDKTVHDFGTITQNSGPQSVTYVVKNNTDVPVLITSVQKYCGCTSEPVWTKEPIDPGKTGTVTAAFDPKNQSGPFEKTVTISTNSTPERITVRIKGIVE